MTAVLAIALQATGAHAVHDAASPQARMIGHLGDLMYWTSAVIFVLVVGALFWAAFRRRAPDEPSDDPARERRMQTVVAWAMGATVATLFAFMLLSYSTGRTLTATPPGQPVQIRVTGYQWWWNVEYRDSLPSNWVTTANEIHVPVGRPVAIELRSSDVIHSLWVPNLGVKRDLIPGQETSIWFQADTPGVYRGECAEFCGHQHAKMAFLVVAEPAERFAAWLVQQRDSARTPSDSLARRGQEVFLASPCVMCHAIQGTPAGSRVGPDLTHLASRRTIAAGTLPNTWSSLAGWIIDPQHIKPGAHMPATGLSPQDLQAVLAYLETLK